MGFTIGDTVKVISGPLKGSVGEITSVSGHLALEVLVAKSTVRAFEGSKTFFRMDQLKVLQKGSRRSASEIIRNLEMRIARLEKTAHWNKMTSKDLVKMIERNGIRLPQFDTDMNLKEAIKLTNRVGRLLGNLMARILMTEGQIRITGTRIVSVNKPKKPFWAAIVSSKGKLIAVDRHFQEAFLEGFKNSDYFEEVISGLHEQEANYPVSANEYPQPSKLMRRIDFSVMGSDLVITLKQ